jgi:hypothetical protein
LLRQSLGTVFSLHLFTYFMNELLHPRR